MYLPILSPIGAIDGMFGYGSPGAPGTSFAWRVCARAESTDAHAAVTKIVITNA
jgi:hypothetical protein